MDSRSEFIKKHISINRTGIFGIVCHNFSRAHEAFYHTVIAALLVGLPIRTDAPSQD